MKIYIKIGSHRQRDKIMRSGIFFEKEITKTQIGTRKDGSWWIGSLEVYSADSKYLSVLQQIKGLSIYKSEPKCLFQKSA